MQIAMGYVYIYIYTYTRIYAYECAEWAIADKLHTRFREEEKKEKNTVLEILRRCFFFLFFFFGYFFQSYQGYQSLPKWIYMFAPLHVVANVNQRNEISNSWRKMLFHKRTEIDVPWQKANALFLYSRERY